MMDGMPLAGNAEHPSLFLPKLGDGGLTDTADTHDTVHSQTAARGPVVLLLRDTVEFPVLEHGAHCRALASPPVEPGVGRVAPPGAAGDPILSRDLLPASPTPTLAQHEAMFLAFHDTTIPSSSRPLRRFLRCLT
jgi:hypothetical protein